MKKYLTILIFFLASTFSVIAQDDDQPGDNAGRLQQRMKEYVQKKLGLSTTESEKFSPIFLRYIVELRRTHRDNKDDKPMQQLRIAELRIRFRNEFKQVLDEQRANKVFEYQREFENKIRSEIMERKMEQRPGARRFKAGLP